MWSFLFSTESSSSSSNDPPTIIRYHHSAGCHHWSSADRSHSWKVIENASSQPANQQSALSRKNIKLSLPHLFAGASYFAVHFGPVVIFSLAGAGSLVAFLYFFALQIRSWQEDSVARIKIGPGRLTKTMQTVFGDMNGWRQKNIHAWTRERILISHGNGKMKDHSYSLNYFLLIEHRCS